MRVDGATQRGSLDPSALSASDVAEIERTLADRVLHIASHPEASIDGTVALAAPGCVEFHGQLTLHGGSLPLDAQASLAPGQVKAKMQLIPSRWGVEPYKAMGGALRLEDRVDVELLLPLTDADFDPARLAEFTAHWRSPHDYQSYVSGRRE